MRLKSFTKWQPVLWPIIVFCLLGIYALNGVIWHGETAVLDHALHLQNDSSRGWMRIVSDLGKGGFMFPLIFCFLLWLMVKREWRYALFLVTCEGPSLLNPFLKGFFHRDKPPQIGRLSDLGYGFPSGHATFTCALILGSLLILWRANRAPGIGKDVFRAVVTLAGCAFIIMVGWSRIYLQAHYPSDVLGAWAASVAWVNAMWILLSPHAPDLDPAKSIACMMKRHTEENSN